jgi:hypothetical protein
MTKFADQSSETPTIQLPGWNIYPLSVARVGKDTYFLARQEGGIEKRLGLSAGEEPRFFQGIEQKGEGVWLCPLSAANMACLRQRLPWLQPQPLGLGLTFGFGDRLGLATPGHITAIRSDVIHDGEARPIFAQQSVRENARTGRSPQMVMDDAAWGVFQEGWQGPWGADADHIKEPDDIEAFVSAGYTLFTFDPGDYVDGAADEDSIEDLRTKVDNLPWAALRSSPEAMYRAYLERSFTLENGRLVFDEMILLRAVAKYGRAIAHTVALYERLAQCCVGRPFEVEVSVDETDTPTTVKEHLFIASELKRLGVVWISLAPRFVGSFEKGVDYIGDKSAFALDVQGHAAVARALGPYKLSLHSGSDKFSIYPLVYQATNGIMHVKTAGTSYLEALRVLAQNRTELFRQIFSLARDRFETDRHSYIISADLERVPRATQLKDAELPDLLNDFHARQVLHVTYGSVLDRYGAELQGALASDEECYTTALESHFRHHLKKLRNQSC